MKKKPAGRPNQGRSEYLEVRLTPEEKAKFEQAAQATHLSLSDWVRVNLHACSAPQNIGNLPSLGSGLQATTGKPAGGSGPTRLK